MTEFVIHAAGEVPLPFDQPTRKLVSKYPFDKLTEVGMAFDIPSSAMSKANADTLVSRWSQKLKCRFRYTFVPDEPGGSVGIIRFWRES